MGFQEVIRDMVINNGLDLGVIIWKLQLTLEKTPDIKAVKTRLFNSPGVWVYAPKEFTITSENS